MSPAPSPGRRIRVAQGLALLALGASLVGALGPAERVRTTYSWPPATLPAEKPERAWYTPLFLIRHAPEALTVTLPSCALPPALPQAETPTTVLATARYPDRVEGLALTREGDRLRVTLGDRVLARADLGAGPLDGACSYELRMADSAWVLEDAGGAVVASGELDRRPVVTGLFSALDLRADGAPRAEVTTEVHATRTTTRQIAAWTIAALAIASALFLVSVPSGARRPWTVAAGLLSGARRHARAPDAVVGAVLALWWIVSPAYFDDGWVASRERMFESSRGFPTYYSAFGVNMPLDYWLEWLHHWLAQSTPLLLWNRLPAVLCLAGVWVLCRWMAVRILSPRVAPDGVPLWTLASVFVIGAVAWGITLRPEPVTALLVTAVAAAMLVFLERESTAAVALAAALVAFALSAHPAGIVSLSPIVIAAPRLLRWLRPNAAAATAIVAAALALLALLLFVGADLEQRRLDTQLNRTYNFDENWRDELTRYSLLVQHHYGTPLRRISVALIGVAALAFLVRRRRERDVLLDFPAATLIAGLVLLVATPSKWPSHFGTLLGVAAVAFCCEAARVRMEGRRSDGWRAWPFVAVAAASGAVTWAWLRREDWNVADLRTLDWTPAFPAHRLAAALPVLVLVGALVLARVRRRERLHAVPWRVASWIGPLVAVPVFAFTTAMLLADTAKTSSWTLARQNLSSLSGADVGCGLGDALVVPRRESARALSVAAAARVPADAPSWVPAAPVAGLPRYPLGPTQEGSASTPWFTLPPARELGLFVTGAPAPSDRLRLEWGRAAGGGVTQLGVDELDVSVGVLSGDAPWRLYGAGDLPTPPERATAVRIVLLADVAPGAALAVTAPVTYETEPLTSRIAKREARNYVFANLLLYFPCAKLPELGQGVVEVPEHVVTWRNDFSPLRYQLTSPFLGVLDLYDLEQLPLTDGEDAPADVLAYEVDREIPGAVRLAPEATTVTS